MISPEIAAIVFSYLCPRQLYILHMHNAFKEAVNLLGGRDIINKMLFPRMIYGNITRSCNGYLVSLVSMVVFYGRGMYPLTYCKKFGHESIFDDKSFIEHLMCRFTDYRVKYYEDDKYYNVYYNDRFYRIDKYNHIYSYAVKRYAVRFKMLHKDCKRFCGLFTGKGCVCFPLKD